MGRSSLAIIIPAKNEAKTIGRVIINSSKYGSVIVVDDASTDETAKVSSLNGAIVLRNKKSLFYDKSLNRGFQYAKKKNFKFIITVDADGEHDLNRIPLFIENLSSGYDLIIGKRKVLPRISEKIISLYYMKKFKIKDLYCGMKGYNVKWVKVFKVFDRFDSIGTDLATRIIKKKNTKFKEIEIEIIKRNGTPRMGNKFFANFKIFKSFFLNLIKN